MVCSVNVWLNGLVRSLEHLEGPGQSIPCSPSAVGIGRKPHTVTDEADVTRLKSVFDAFSELGQDTESLKGVGVPELHDAGYVLGRNEGPIRRPRAAANDRLVAFQSGDYMRVPSYIPDLDGLIDTCGCSVPAIRRECEIQDRFVVRKPFLRDLGAMNVPEDDGTVGRGRPSPTPVGGDNESVDGGVVSCIFS